MKSIFSKLKKILYLLPLLLLAAIPSYAQTHWIVGYYTPGSNITNATSPSFSPQCNSSSFPFNEVTHMIMIGSGPNNNGSINYISNYSSLTNTMVACAHAQGVKVLMDLGSANAQSGGFNTMYGDGNMATFVANIVAAVATYNFDGVDIDYEESWNASLITALLSGLRNPSTGLPSGKLLTATSGQANTNWTGTAVPICDSGNGFSTTQENYLDRLFLMAYDQGNYGNGDPATWLNSALYSPTNQYYWSVDNLFRATQYTGGPNDCAIAASKVVILLPFYGDMYSGNSGPGQAPAGAQTQFQTPYSYISNYSIGSPTYDANGMSPWQAQSSSSYLSWADAKYIGLVGAYCISKGCSGLGPWTLGWDGSGYPLLYAMYNSLNGGASPNISSLSVTSGNVGTSVTITGTGFGASQGSSTVTFNGIAATVGSWGATSITTTVPSTATTGSVVVTVSSAASNGITFTVTPNISSLSVSTGPVGTSVTVTGTGFGASQGSSTIKFNGTTATASSWSAASIVTTVPSGASTGSVIVTVSGVASNGSTFTVTGGSGGPSISGLSVTSGSVGTVVVITGTSFGSSQGGSTVTFNGTSATASIWSSTSIHTTVPSGASTGNVVVTVSSIASNGEPFTVTGSGGSAPTRVQGIACEGSGASVTCTLPDSVTSTDLIVWAATAAYGSTIPAITASDNCGGAYVTVDTSNKTGTQNTVAQGYATGASGSCVVTFAGSGGTSFVTGIAEEITSATLDKHSFLSGQSVTGGSTITTTSVTTTSADYMWSYAVEADANGGAPTVASPFTVRNNQSVFGEASADYTQSALGAVTATWTMDSTTADAVVGMMGFTGTGSGSTPTISSLSVYSGPIGTPVTITGTNYGASQGGSTVTFDGTAATITSWSATSIVTTVPSGATTGNVVVTVSSVASNGLSFTVTTPGSSLPTRAQGVACEASGTSVTCTIPSSVTSGDIVQYLSSELVATTTSALTVTNSCGGTATAVGSVVGPPSGTHNYTGQGYITGMSGSCTVTFSWSNTPEFVTGVLEEITPGTLNKSSLLGTQSVTGGSTFTTTSVSPTVAAYCVSMAVDANAEGGSPVASSPFVNHDSSSVFGIADADSTQGSTGAITATWTISTTTTGAAAGMMCWVGSAPALSSLSVNNGPETTAVTITGTGFGSSQGSSTVTFNSTVATAGSWSATSIGTTVPTGATTGPVVVAVGGQASNSLTFTVTPYISGLSESSGSVGDSVIISGTTFGSTQGSSTVTFNGVTATASAWSSTSVTVTVPSAATTGNVIVTVLGQASNGSSFTVNPGISLSVSSGPVSTSVTITGTGFGASQGGSTVTFNGTTAIATIWSSTSIQTTVPSAATTGNVVVTVGGQGSSGVSFTVTPFISSLSVSSGIVGTTVIITGTTFGSSQGGSTATFNGSAATASSWGVSSITVTVPSTGTTGNVVVTVSGHASNGVNFTVPPNISSLGTTSGPVGTSVTINGTTFGSSQGSSTIKFNGATATATGWTSTSITTSVPSGATTGSVIVTVSGNASNSETFTVTPHISSLSVSSGPVGTSVIVTGTTFGSSQGASTITFNGVTASVGSWGATSITATVPSGAATGNVVVTVAAQASNNVTFTVTPGVTSLSVSNGPEGTTVIITGTTFGASQGGSSVAFNGTTATASAWSATSITTSVPSGATTGVVQVTVSSQASNGVTFTVTPAIASLGTTSGPVTTSVTITGTTFGSIQGSSAVTFNGTVATVTGWTATSITTSVPLAATTGSVVVTVGAYTSNGIAFTVTPHISALSVSTGPVGTSVTIVGTPFGSSQGSSTVAFNGTTATAVGWSTTAITTSVPGGATTGSIVVTVSSQASNGVTFTVTASAPVINSLTANIGPVGTSVTISGANFGLTQGGSTVAFAGTDATASAWSSTSITTSVPSGATTGNIVVTVSSAASNGVLFTVSAAPTTPAATVPIPLTPRTTAAAAVFDCIFIASPQGAQTLTDLPAQIASLQQEYAQLLSVYRQITNQDEANTQAKLVAAVNTAVTAVGSLLTTVDAITVQPATHQGPVLANMQIVVYNALTNLKNVQSNEQ